MPADESKKNNFPRVPLTCPPAVYVKIKSEPGAANVPATPPAPKAVLAVLSIVAMSAKVDSVVASAVSTTVSFTAILNLSPAAIVGTVGPVSFSTCARGVNCKRLSTASIALSNAYV